jgi:LysW-gamma-L-lysine carboxypeptidase
VITAESGMQVEQAEQTVTLLTEMLEIPSVSTQEAKLGQWLVRRMRELGFSARRDEVGNVIGYWGSGPREVMLLGHMDTVPGWIPVRVEENRLHGRGAVDAKGPLAAAIAAVARQDAGSSCRFTVIAAVEEEGTSRGARHLVSRRPPEHLIILEPSGWDAVTLGYKGSLRIRYRLSQPAGHGAGPLSSAGDRAVAFLRLIQDHASADRGGKGSFDRLDTRVIRFHADHDGMRDVANLTLGLRLPPGFDIDSFKDQVSKWGEDAEVKFETADPAIRTEKNTPLVRRFVQAIRETGGTPRFKMKTGTSDMNILVPAWGCPALAYGPGDSKLDHTPFEAIDLDEYRRGIDVLTSALRQL